MKKTNKIGYLRKTAISEPLIVFSMVAVALFLLALAYVILQIFGPF